MNLNKRKEYFEENFHFCNRYSGEISTFVIMVVLSFILNMFHDLLYCGHAILPILPIYNLFSKVYSSHPAFVNF